MSLQSSTEFFVVNKVHDLLDPSKFLNGPWIHLATAKRRDKEYIAIQQLFAEKNIFLMELKPDSPPYLFTIKEDSEWEDLNMYLASQGIFSIGQGVEFALSEKYWNWMLQNTDKLTNPKSKKQ